MPSQAGRCADRSVGPAILRRLVLACRRADHRRRFRCHRLLATRRMRSLTQRPAGRSTVRCRVRRRLSLHQPRCYSRRRRNRCTTLRRHPCMRLTSRSTQRPASCPRSANRQTARHRPEPLRPVNLQPVHHRPVSPPVRRRTAIHCSARPLPEHRSARLRPVRLRLVRRRPESRSPESRSPESRSPESRSPESRSPEIQNPEIQNPEIQNPETQSLATRCLAQVLTRFRPTAIGNLRQPIRCALRRCSTRCRWTHHWIRPPTRRCPTLRRFRSTRRCLLRATHPTHPMRAMHPRRLRSSRQIHRQPPPAPPASAASRTPAQAALHRPE